VGQQTYKHKQAYVSPLSPLVQELCRTRQALQRSTQGSLWCLHSIFRSRGMRAKLMQEFNEVLSHSFSRNPLGPTKLWLPASPIQQATAAGRTT